MPLKSFSTSNAFLHVPEPVVLNSQTAKYQHQHVNRDDVQRSTPHPRPRTLVFFLTGNPGLIGYYLEFLELLSNPSTSSRDANAKVVSSNDCYIAGYSLAGVSITDSSSSTSSSSGSSPLLSSEPGHTDREGESSDVPISYDSVIAGEVPPSSSPDGYSLDEEVELSYLRISRLAEEITRDEVEVEAGDNERLVTTTNSHTDPDPDRSPTVTSASSKRFQRSVQVVLIGHSLGSFMALELIQKHHRHHRTASQPCGSLNFSIAATILLTPTITDLALSPGGRLVAPLAGTIPYFPRLIQLFASGLTSAFPTNWLRGLVSRITGMKPESKGLDATVRFLTTSGCVRQSMMLLKDEIRQIASDKWGEEVWGSIAPPALCAKEKEENRSPDESRTRQHEEPNTWHAPRLFFWFPKTDHWVADTSRDKIIETRLAHLQHQQQQQQQADEQEGEPTNTGNVDGVVDRGVGDEPSTASPAAVVMVDESGELVHAWSLEGSGFVAKQVRLWIEDVVRT